MAAQARRLSETARGGRGLRRFDGQICARDGGAAVSRRALMAGQEQDRGMRIDIGIVDTVPRGVDTPADLETTRRILASRF